MIHLEGQRRRLDVVSYFSGIYTSSENPIHEFRAGGDDQVLGRSRSYSRSTTFFLLPHPKPCLTRRLALFSVTVTCFSQCLERRLRSDYIGLAVRRPHRTRWPVSSHHRPSPFSRVEGLEGEVVVVPLSHNNNTA